jgi:hypothetical protein
MVASRTAPWRNRHGKARLGCLFTLLLVAVGAYYGAEIGGVYLDYYRMKDFMREQAAIAPSLSDTTIYRRVLQKVEELGLPEEAQEITVRRTSRPREIIISTTYSVTIDTPFYRRTIILTPEARQPLF